MSKRAFWDWKYWVQKRFPVTYAKRLWKQLPAATRPRRQQFVQLVLQQMAALQRSHRSMVVDDASEIHLMMTSCVLASYQVLLSNGWNAETAIQSIRQAFISMGQNWIRFIVRWQLRSTRKPLQLLRKIALRRADEDYGSTFEFEHRLEEDQRYVMIVKRCFYHDFFSRNRVPQLTTVFCQWDQNWASAIDPKRDGVQFQRPVTLGYGGDHCRFEFVQVHLPPSSHQ